MIRTSSTTTRTITFTDVDRQLNDDDIAGASNELNRPRLAVIIVASLSIFVVAFMVTTNVQRCNKKRKLCGASYLPQINIGASESSGNAQVLELLPLGDGSMAGDTTNLGVDHESEIVPLPERGGMPMPPLAGWPPLTPRLLHNARSGNGNTVTDVFGAGALQQTVAEHSFKYDPLNTPKSQTFEEVLSEFGMPLTGLESYTRVAGLAECGNTAAAPPSAVKLCSIAPAKPATRVYESALAPPTPSRYHQIIMPEESLVPSILSLPRFHASSDYGSDTLEAAASPESARASPFFTDSGGSTISADSPFYEHGSGFTALAPMPVWHSGLTSGIGAADILTGIAPNTCDGPSELSLNDEQMEVLFKEAAEDRKRPKIETFGGESPAGGAIVAGKGTLLSAGGNSPFEQAGDQLRAQARVQAYAETTPSLTQFNTLFEQAGGQLRAQASAQVDAETTPSLIKLEPQGAPPARVHGTILSQEHKVICQDGVFKDWVLQLGTKERNALVKSAMLSKEEKAVLVKSSRIFKQSIAHRKYREGNKYQDSLKKARSKGYKVPRGGTPI